MPLFESVLTDLTRPDKCLIEVDPFSWYEHLTEPSEDEPDYDDKIEEFHKNRKPQYAFFLVVALHVVCCVLGVQAARNASVYAAGRGQARVFARLASAGAFVAVEAFILIRVCR